jgi:hypothetical protein
LSVRLELEDSREGLKATISQRNDIGKVTETIDIHRQHQGRGEGTRKGARAEPWLEDLRHRLQSQHRDGAFRDLNTTRQWNGTCGRHS